MQIWEHFPLGLGHTMSYNEWVVECYRTDIHRRNCMKQYETKEILTVKKVVCNKCGKEIVVENGRLLEDMLQIEKRWGYPSRKDNEVHSFDLCEQCYDEWIATFLIPIEK